MNKLYNFSNFEIVKGNGCYLYTSNKAMTSSFHGRTIGSQIHEFKVKLSSLLSKGSNKNYKSHIAMTFFSWKNYWGTFGWK